MKKEDIRAFCDYVEKRLDNSNLVGFDTWSNEPIETLTPVAKHMYELGSTYTYNGETYIISYSPARQGMGGMGEGSPESWTVKKLESNKLIDVDKILSQKEIIVADWMGGEERIDTIGLDRGSDGEYRYKYDINVLDLIVNAIMERTTYSIMINRIENGDTIVYIDDKRFRQR